MASIFPNFYEPPLKEGLPRSEPLDIPAMRKRTQRMPTENPMQLWPSSASRRHLYLDSFTSSWQRWNSEERAVDKTGEKTKTPEEAPPVKKMRRFVYIKKSDVLGYPPAGQLTKSSSARGRRRKPRCRVEGDGQTSKVQSLLEEAQFKLEKVRHYKEHWERTPDAPTPPFPGRKRAQSLTMMNHKSRPIAIPSAGDYWNDESCELLSRNLQRTLFVKQISDPCGVQPPKKNFPDIPSSDEDNQEEEQGHEELVPDGGGANMKSRASYRSWRKFSQMHGSRSRRIQRESGSQHGEEDVDDDIEDAYEGGPPGQGTHYCSSASEDETESIVPMICQSDREDLLDDTDDHFKFVLNDDLD